MANGGTYEICLAEQALSEQSDTQAGRPARTARWPVPPFPLLPVHSALVKSCDANEIEGTRIILSHSRDTSHYKSIAMMNLRQAVAYMHRSWLWIVSNIVNTS
eukprot:6214557-Pleurochrysis_carterae.AAC.1